MALEIASSMCRSSAVAGAATTIGLPDVSIIVFEVHRWARLLPDISGTAAPVVCTRTLCHVEHWKGEKGFQELLHGLGRHGFVPLGAALSKSGTVLAVGFDVNLSPGARGLTLRPAHRMAPTDEPATGPTYKEFQCHRKSTRST
jgi:hypothetical protein